MKIQAKAGTQFAALDDSSAGEGLAIFLSQSDKDTVRWHFEVMAKLDTGAELIVGSFDVSPPLATTPIGNLTRQVAAAVCPGAISWSVTVKAAIGSVAAPTETADLTLISSKCCTAPVGVSRVAERYGYIAGSAASATALVNLFAGQVVTKIIAIGLAGGGTVIVAGGPGIPVPAGAQVVLEPKAPIPFGTAVLSFTNVVYVVEYLESA